MSIQNEGLVFEGRLPVLFQVIESFPTDDTFLFLNEKNERILRASLLPMEPKEFEEHDEVGLMLWRQELKISMLMDLVGELVTNQQGKPPVSSLLLTPSYLECADLPGTTDSIIECSLYLSPNIPQALKLYGLRVNREGQGVEENTDSSARMQFRSMARSVQDLLEKVIFRQHRRQVAQGLESPED